MWTSLLRISARILWKDRFYAGITLVGLAVAFAAAIFIALWVRFELKWEPFLQDADAVRGIAIDIHVPSAKGFHTLNSPTGLREELDAALGDRITTARYQPESIVFAVGDRRSKETVGTADPNFFRIITVPFLAGDPAHALDEPNSVVLTRSFATKYFGTKDPMGQVVELQHAAGKVTGLIDDLPDNSLFKQGAYMSAQSDGSFLRADRASPEWFDLNAFTLVRLAPGTSDAELLQVLRRLQVEKYPDDATSGVQHVFELIKLRDAHLLGIVYGQTRDRTSLVALGLVGIVILGIARVNFVNLATARATRRTREVGVRKALGASRLLLTVQLLVEPMLLATAALVIAFVAIELLLPSVSKLLGVRLVFSIAREPVMAAGIIASGLTVGLAAGLYPALLLSRMTPIAALNAAGRSNTGSNVVRQLMVMLQFAASIGLIVVTIFLQRQTEHARDVNLTRVAGDPLVVLSDLQRLPDLSTRQLLAQRLADEPRLRGATASSLAQGDTKQTLSTRTDIVPGATTTYSVVRIDQNFFPVHGRNLIAGRNLDDARDTNVEGRNVAVVSTSAAKLFGFADPRDAIGRTIGGSSDPTDVPIEIVGVVDEFPLHTVQEVMGPTIFVDQPERFRFITVRVPGDHLREGLDAIDRIWKEVAPAYPIQRQFADARVQTMWVSTQNEADVLTSFALVAVVIGCLGLFGLAAYTAQRRTKEIGIRKAMGASTMDVVRLLVLHLTWPVVVANLLAWPVALWVTHRWLANFADRIPIQIWPFLVAGLGTLLLAWSVVIGHALAVGRAQPSYALRYE